MLSRLAKWWFCDVRQHHEGQLQRCLRCGALSVEEVIAVCERLLADDGFSFW